MTINERGTYEERIRRLEDQRTWLLVILILIANAFLIHKIMSMLGWI